MSTNTESYGDKHTTEGFLNTVHSRLRWYANDQLTILDDIMSIIETFYKTEKHTHEKMKLSLQKSLEHTQTMPYIGSSITGLSWSTGIKDLLEHYAQREASYPVLKRVILENLRKIKSEKLDEHNKVLIYHEEIIRDIVDIERRASKAKRTFDDQYERLKQKESGIKRLQQKILSKNELELEITFVDARNFYILQVHQMNYILKFYLEQFLVDLDKLLVCDLFPQIKQVLDDLVYVEYKRLHDTLQQAVQTAIQDGDEQKRRLLPKVVPNYPLILPVDQSDQVNIDDRCVPHLSMMYQAAINDVREIDQHIQITLENSVLNAQQNKDSRIDSAKIKLKRLEMKKSLASFVIDTLESLVPNIKTAPTTPRPLKSLGGLKPLITTKLESNGTNITMNNPVNDLSQTSSSIDIDNPSLSTSSNAIYPCQAIVLYDFDAANEDELSVRKDDKIFIEAKPEYEGWLIAKGRDRSGLVPESYVQLIPPLEQKPKKHSNIRSTSKHKSSRKSKKSTSDANVNNNTSATVVSNEADYFSDD